MLYALYSNIFVHLVTISLQRTYFGLLMNAKEPSVNARLQGAPDRFPSAFNIEYMWKASLNRKYKATMSRHYFTKFLIWFSSNLWFANSENQNVVIMLSCSCEVLSSASLHVCQKNCCFIWICFGLS